MKKRTKIIIASICSVLTLAIIVFFVSLLIAIKNMSPLMGGVDLHTFSTLKDIPNDFNTHCFLDLSELPADSQDILLSYVGHRDPEYFISFSASKESIMKYVLAEAKTEIENLPTGSFSENKWVNDGPLDKNAKPVNHPLWDLKSVKKGKIFNAQLRCIIVDVENNRVYDARATM